MTRKKKTMPRPRKVNATISVKVPSGISHKGVGINATGDIYLIGPQNEKIDPEEISRELFHERDKGPKIRTRRFLGTGVGALGEFSDLAKFDDIYVIDTNTRVIDGIQVSACIFLRIEIEEGRESFLFKLPEKHPNIYIFRGEQKKPELYSIQKLVSDLINSQSFCSTRRIAIITDTELDKLAEINEGKVPLLANFFLPHRFSLHYASADIGWEFLNKIIKSCDRQAGTTLREYSESPPDQMLFRVIQSKPKIEFLHGTRNATISYSKQSVPKSATWNFDSVDVYGITHDGAKELIGTASMPPPLQDIK